MKTLRKFLTLVLSLCMATYALPGFAYSLSSEGNAAKVELTDEAMSQAVGAGNVDATMADIRNVDTTAKAVIVNRSILYCTYAMNVVDVNGGLVASLASGTLSPGAALQLTGVLPIGAPKIVQAKITNSGVPGLLSLDTSWANN